MSRDARREIGEYLAAQLVGIPGPLTFADVDEIERCIDQASAVLDPGNDDRLTHLQQIELLDCASQLFAAYGGVYWRTVAAEMFLDGRMPPHVAEPSTRIRAALLLLQTHALPDRRVVDAEIERRRIYEQGRPEA